MPQTNIRTAAEALKRILDDNAAFMGNHPLEGFFDAFLGQQRPFATVVLCSDSRCQLEAFCNQPFNNIFEVANAGNRFRADKFSVTYGVRFLHTPLLLIIGHTDCGAIKAAMGGYDGDNEDILSGLEALHMHSRNHDHENPDHVLQHAVANVGLQAHAAMRTYKDMVDAGTLTIAGGLFDMHNQLGQGNGKLYLFNINGDTSLDKLRNHPMSALFTEADKNTSLLDIGPILGQ